MPSALDRNKVRTHLENFDLRPLFIEELGWDHGGSDSGITIADRSFSLKAVAHKRGMIAYQYVADSDMAFPDHPTRQKIEKAVAKTVREHIIVYASHDKNTQYWQWVKREPGRPDRSRLHIYYREQPGEALIQKLEHLVFALEEEDDLTILDVSGRVRAAFDVERVTKKFYERFKMEHVAFLGFIEGIKALADREWYASLMLNRMMFIYFIQKRGFLDGDLNYLRSRLERMQKEHGKDRFQTFYRLFLSRLFHEGLSQPAGDRAPELSKILGRVPYLNGGLFDVHDLERDNEDISIPDKAFHRIFNFFDAYQWHLDDTPLHDDKEINPDVLGYIFEKYINQKQMGAYYTKEDITGYISRNTVIPFLFDQARKECPIDFKPGGGVWRLLQDNPDRYFYEAVRHGITYDIHQNQDLAEKRALPPDIAAGLDDVSKRDRWNNAAPPDCALPTESWREHVVRRQHYEDVRAKLAAGDVASINDLITYNLDIEKFAQDAIAGSEGPELVRAFWMAINKVSILDPTCGSGAFLFAVLNILEPIYIACLESMRGFLDDLERSKRNHHPDTMNDFRKVMERVAAHASERYFILKSIVIGNLYGVDIMEEAVEICKLRLFLKLVAQLESYDQIEPLPDIDFNIRAGNTLVGFTSFEGVARALGADMVRQLALPDIEERAEIAAQAFRKFREMQTEHGTDAAALAGAKSDLRERLDGLRAELDRYLAGEYGVKTEDKKAYEQWRNSHQPFHWFVEFYGIMNAGGFNVIIGNPPYLALRELKSYRPINLKTIVTGNLYPLVLERCDQLSINDGKEGYIVPVSSISTVGYSALQDLYAPYSVIFSSFDDRPAHLFTGLDKNTLSILLKCNSSGETNKNSSRLTRWSGKERESLFSLLEYQPLVKCELDGCWPKIGSEVETSIWKKLFDKSTKLGNFHSRNHSYAVYYSRKVNAFLQILDFIPEVRDGSGKLRPPSEFKEILLKNEAQENAVMCCLNSSLFRWFMDVVSDGSHVNRREINNFPFNPCEAANVFPALNGLAREISAKLKASSEYRTMRYQHDKLTIQCIIPLEAKSLIDSVDRLLGRYYSLSDDEIDFIINYDIKYRVGLGGAPP